MRSIEIHTEHTPIETDMTMIESAECPRAVLRIHIGSATVNIFGDLNRQAEIRRTAAMLLRRLAKLRHNEAPQISTSPSAQLRRITPMGAEKSGK